MCAVGSTIGFCLSEIQGGLMARFDGRCAIVTGGASGIGKATAIKLAAEGANVVIVDLDLPLARLVASDIEASDGSAFANSTDVTDPIAVVKLVESAVQRFGDVSVLVNAAGLLRRTPADAISPSEWQVVIEADLTSVFLCSVAVHKSMQQVAHGRIINVASMAGRATSTLGGAHYTASKAAVLGLTRHLAREWSSPALTVNAVSPGIVDTPMVLNLTSVTDLIRIAETLPVRRLAQPWEVASLICFLASDDACLYYGRQC